MAGYNLLEGKKVLIVDDEADVLETLEELLSMCDVTKASNFQEGKKALETEDLDLAVLDIMGVDGYGLLDLAIGKQVLAVMLTAHALTPEETANSYKRGAAYFIPKEEMASITTFLNDVLEAKEKGENYWTTWLDRLDAYYEKKFGTNWKDRDKNFWDAIAKRNWRLASVLRKQEEEGE